MSRGSKRQGLAYANHGAWNPNVTLCQKQCFAGTYLQLERGTRKNMHAWPCLSKYVKVILAKEQPWAVPHEGSFYIQCPWPKAVMAMGCHGPWDVNWSSLLIFSHFTHSTSTTSLNFTDFTLKGRDVKQKGKMTLLRQGVEFGHWTLTCSGYCLCPALIQVRLKGLQLRLRKTGVVLLATDRLTQSHTSQY